MTILSFVHNLYSLTTLRKHFFFLNECQRISQIFLCYLYTTCLMKRLSQLESIRRATHHFIQIPNSFLLQIYSSRPHSIYNFFICCVKSVLLHSKMFLTFFLSARSESSTFTISAELTLGLHS